MIKLIQKTKTEKNNFLKKIGNRAIEKFKQFVVSLRMNLLNII